MVRTIGGTPQHSVAREIEGLLATKLHLPRPPSGFVSRPRLTQRLDEGLARGLTLLCAPPGFGKSALLADWSRRREVAVAWVSLDAGDNDPARFWGHVVAALDRIRPGIAERTAPFLSAQPPAPLSGLVAAMINELAAEPEDAVLILDDYHLIDSAQVRDSLLFLLEGAPSGLHVVLASRSDPTLPLARLRARGRLVELRAADLRFTADEAAELLRASVGADLPCDAVEALAARTEGWAAGLQLAALALRGRADVDRFVSTFSGSHRYVIDYLTEEVLDHQPSAVREFLLDTSVLERLSGSLCDAVTGRTDGQTMLEEIERANLFLVPLDEVRGWWRYHQLFADLLRARLTQDQPEKAAQLHRKAGIWSEAHDLPDDAVHYAIGARDPVWAARLVERHADAFLMRAEGETVRRWIDALPPELVGSRPRLLLIKALLGLITGRMNDIEAHLEAAEIAWAQGSDEQFEPSVGPTESLLANVPAALTFQRGHLAVWKGQTDRAMALLDQALAEIGEGEWVLGAVIRGHMGVAQWLSGDVEEAERSSSSSIARWLEVGQRYTAARVSQHLALVQRAGGRLDAALNTYTRLLEFATPSGGGSPHPAAGMAHAGMAEIAYQRGRQDDARRHVSDGIALCRQLANTQPLATCLATLAWIRQIEGDPAGALDAMNEAERVADTSVADLINPVPVQRARLLLAQGALAAVADWLAERGIDMNDEPSYGREPGWLVLARVLLGQGQPRQSLTLLQRLEAMAVSQGRAGSLIEIRALKALALAAAGDQDAAMSALAEALSLGHSQGYVRVFVDEGPPMAALLSRFITTSRVEPARTSDVPRTYVSELLRTFEEGAAGRRGESSEPTELATTLSHRELEVLRLLAAGKPNQEIADELFVAVSTVKKHVTHILDKLGAANRTEATARGRELGLLP